MNEWLSNKFKWLSFVATWAVVCIHSRNGQWVSNVEDWATRLQDFIMPAFNFAVPLFFAISGFFFVSSYDKCVTGGGHFFLRKIRSLYVPAVLWLWINLVFRLPIRWGTSHSLPSFFDSLFCPVLLWIERGEAVQFWYVRALLFLFILAPVLRLIVRKWYLALAVILYFSIAPSWPDYQEGGYNLIRQFPVSISFFLLGAAISANSKFVARIHSNSKLGIVIALVGLALSFLPNHNGSRFGQILFLWGLYDIIDHFWTIPKLPKWMACCFFVYCVHMIVMGWVGGVLKLSFGTSPLARTVSYFIRWMTFGLDVVLANLVARYFPRVYAVLSGGRT